jgi:hypothetical protein
VRPTKTLDAGDGPFTAADLLQLERRGVSLEEAYRQLALLSRAPSHLPLVRPCTVGDGIETIAEEAAIALAALGRRAAEAGRVAAFVPASGAASRMFKELIEALAANRPLDRASLEEDLRGRRPAAEALDAFLAGLDRFAFRPELEQALARRGRRLDLALERGDYRALLEALLSPAGLGYGEVAKGLLPFHAYVDETRTAFDEHLVEAGSLAVDAQRRCRVHFTVSPEHLDRFLARLEQVRSAHEARFGARCDVEFSVQKPSTDTIAADFEGRPFRTGDGALLFRPAGHGALIENLAELDADLAFMKNVDNVAIDALKPAALHWGRVLLGRLVELQARIFALLARLEDPRDPAAVDESFALAGALLHRAPPAGAPDHTPGLRRGYAIDLLHRPLRVCGMVPNTGEPGGGPFWVSERDGTPSLQIVELSQIDRTVEAQRAALAASTHFNPVFMACGLRDHRGDPYPLGEFLDPDAVIVTRRSHAGRDLVTLERPGLWNGAMAGWNTVFVEVPLAVFNPVKTVLDLLRPEHQPQR